MQPRRRRTAILFAAGAAALTLVLGACGDDDDASPATDAGTATETEADQTAGELDGVVDIDGDRGLYVRCTGTGSPTVVMEGGDGDTSDQYAFAEAEVAAVTRTCVYDRANLGRSDPAPGPRGLEDLVGDLEGLLESAEIPSPYVLVGTSGGGYIAAGFAVEHPEETAGIVLVDTAAPFPNPPQEIVEETDPRNPQNVEKRDFLQVERDAWAARERIGDIPVRVISVRFSQAEIAASPFPSEKELLRTNVERQRGWLVLSPSAEQIVVDTGHAVEEEDPQLVIDTILDVVEAAR
jgi:pimeloyl-ACP methyl ester carboxylesterase